MLRNQLNDDDRLTYSSAPVGPHLSAFHEGCNQVEDFYARLEQLIPGLLLLEGGAAGAVDGPVLCRPPLARGCQEPCQLH